MEKRPILRLGLSGQKGKARANCLFDSGSTRCAIRGDLARKLDRPRRFSIAVPIRLATDGPPVQVREWISLDVRLDGRGLTGHFAVVETLRRPVVLGADFMDDWDIHLHMRGGRVSVGIDSNGTPA